MRQYLFSFYGRIACKEVVSFVDYIKVSYYVKKHESAVIIHIFIVSP